jgi:hypothetical protein
VPEFILQSGIDALIEVLDHPNPDIAFGSVTLLAELTDEDLISTSPQAKKVVEILVR